MTKSIKHILKKELDIKVGGKLWLESEGERFFGPGPMELLEKIEETGSISSAAKAMNMSYKKAWELINHLNDQTNSPVVIPQTGGEKGGGAVGHSERFDSTLSERGLVWLFPRPSSLIPRPSSLAPRGTSTPATPTPRGTA